MAQNGPAMTCVRSRTRMPSSAHRALAVASVPDVTIPSPFDMSIASVSDRQRRAKSSSTATALHRHASRSIRPAARNAMTVEHVRALDARSARRGGCGSSVRCLFFAEPAARRSWPAPTSRQFRTFDRLADGIELRARRRRGARSRSERVRKPVDRAGRRASRPAAAARSRRARICGSPRPTRAFGVPIARTLGNRLSMTAYSTLRDSSGRHGPER